MKCPKCTHDDTKVLESRLSSEGRAVRRRRVCSRCEHRYTTYEKEEEFVFSIEKKDGRVEPYTRTKLFNAVQTACQKRPVGLERLETLVAEIEKEIQEAGTRTVPSAQLGDMVMKGLKALDQVAYVRFASVYRDFKDLSEFTTAVESLKENR